MDYGIGISRDHCREVSIDYGIDVCVDFYAKNSISQKEMGACLSAGEAPDEGAVRHEPPSGAHRQAPDAAGG